MCLFALIYSVKPLVFVFAKSRAETIILNAANRAIINILNDNDITYSDIAVISRDSQNNITGIEIDINKINLLKSLVSIEMSENISDEDTYELNIPIGTLIGSEYTTGFGPKIKFKMQLTETAVVDFESRFESSGINSVLHQILINIDVTASVLMMGFTQGFNISTSAIAAQTVISGYVPDNFTNVDEYPGGDIADEIFNYAELN